MITLSPDEWHPGTPSAAPKPNRPTEDIKQSDDPSRKSYVARVIDLFKNTAKEWVQDRCPPAWRRFSLLYRFFIGPFSDSASRSLWSDLREQ